MTKRVSSVCKEDENYLIFFSNKTSQDDPMHTSKAVFTTLPKSFRQKAESLPLTCENGKNTYNFFRKLIFFQGFRWTCGRLFWQSCWTSFNKKLKKFAQKTKIIKKIHFFPKKLHKIIPRDTLNTVFETEHILLVIQKGLGKVSSFNNFST